MSAVVIIETVRRHLTHVGYLATLILFSAFAAWVGGVDMVNNPVLSFAELAAVLIGAQAIGPEFSSGTLQLILTKPINRATYLLSRVAGMMLAIWILIWVPRLVELLFRLGAQRTVDIPAFLIQTVNVSVEPLIVVSLLALFGTFTRSYLNVACYFLLSMASGAAIAAAAELKRTRMGGVIGAIGSFVRRNEWIERFIRTVNENLFPSLGGESFDPRLIILVITNSAVALLLATLIFRRREVPYGAD